MDLAILESWGGGKDKAQECSTELGLGKRVPDAYG